MGDAANHCNIGQCGQFASVGCHKDDRLVAVYAAPLNEGRGVYMVMSGDNGATWSEPRLFV